MGRTNYSQTGYGMTLDEARRDALRSDLEMHGSEEGYSGGMNSSDGSEDRVRCIKEPKIAKRCKVEKSPIAKGAKWKTIFVAEPQSHFAMERGAPRIERDKKKEALGAAKAAAIKHGATYYVHVEKKLVGSSPILARIAPEKSEMGEWVFSGLAKE